MNHDTDDPGPLHRTASGLATVTAICMFLAMVIAWAAILGR